MIGDNNMKKGFTLIEAVVAVAIFTLMVTAATGFFVSGLRTQKKGLANQEILDQTSYLMEYMSRALRMARKDISGVCTGTARLNYKFENQCLKFLNYHNECQQFCWEGTRIKDENGEYLTSNELEVVSFNVNLSGQYQPPTDYLQPKVTIFLDIKGRSQETGERPEIKIQSTVSQRNPDIRK
jgi:prepilin-type N-terminal cleavage/methylation domain-containing protein